jgi:hypothetical protein
MVSLGIPTLCRYDMLDRLLSSAAAGTLKPSRYIIIDNGGGYSTERARSILGEVPVSFVRNPENRGVAAAWNHILDIAAGPVIISNDDVVFGPETFAEMCGALERSPFVSGDGWALFGQTPECLARVGYYDEHFWPAYYEDVDYAVRLHKAGIPVVRPLSHPVGHDGWATLKALGDPAWLRLGRQRNLLYMVNKWGVDGWDYVSSPLTYETPFNGNPPPGWSLRSRKPVLPMRWEIINAIAEHTGAARYLEIGVEQGECLSLVNVKEKWGVDPGVTIDGVKQCSFFSPMKSLDFLSRLPKGITFDMIFIDGEHLALTVFQEVVAALSRLSPKGVILLHDCNPHFEYLQKVPPERGDWTGDVWKAIAQIRSSAHVHCRVIDADYGVGIIIPQRDGSPAYDAPVLPARPLEWSDLKSDRKRLLGLTPHWEWMEWFKKTFDEETRPRAIAAVPG